MVYVRSTFFPLGEVKEMRITQWSKERPAAFTMGLLLAGALLACGDSTGPPDPTEFFISTDSSSYTLIETPSPGVFVINFVTRFTNAVPDTVHFLSCSGRPFWAIEHLSDGVFSRSEIGPGCATSFNGVTPFPPGAVRTDTLRWFFFNGGNNEPIFNREIPGTFRVSFIVWDSLGENQTGREIAKELRVSAPFDILPVPGTGG